MQDIEETVTIIRNAIRDIPKRYSDNLNQIKRLEQEEQDLLHLVEMVNLNASEGFKIYKDLQRVRKDRRDYKDENELLKHVQPILSSIKNKINPLDNAIGNIRNTKINLSKRSYKVRVRKDLDKVINGIKL